MGLVDAASQLDVAHRQLNDEEDMVASKHR